MIETIKYNGKEYLKIQSIGNAAQFVLPYVKHFCKGTGYDIGSGKWGIPNAIRIDKIIGSDAMRLPDKKVDYIFSSHCLEHLDSWVEAVEHWTTRIKRKGTLFLYLPHRDQEYWRPWNNRKHKNIIHQEDVVLLLKHLKYKKIFYSGIDLNLSYMILAER